MNRHTVNKEKNLEKTIKGKFFYIKSHQNRPKNPISAGFSYLTFK